MLSNEKSTLVATFIALSLAAFAGCPTAVESQAPPAGDDGKTDDTDDGNDTADDATPFQIVIMPEAALSVAVGAEIEVSIYAVNSKSAMLTDSGNATLVSNKMEVANTKIEGSQTGTTTATITGVASGTAILTATLAGLTATKNVTVGDGGGGGGGGEGGGDDEVDWDHCCPLATKAADDKNMCYIPPGDAKCPMTLGDGYCDKDGDGNYSTPDANYPACESNGDGCNSAGWEQGWEDAKDGC